MRPSDVDTSRSTVGKICRHSTARFPVAPPAPHDQLQWGRGGEGRWGMGLRFRDARPFCCAKSRRVTRGAAAHFRCACAWVRGACAPGCPGRSGVCRLPAARGVLSSVTPGSRRSAAGSGGTFGQGRRLWGHPAQPPGDGPGRARQRRGLGTAPPAREGGVPLGLRQGQLEGRQAGLGSGVRLNLLSTTGSISGSAPSAGRFQGPHETWPGDTAARLRRERRGRGPQRRSQHELWGAVCVDG